MPKLLIRDPLPFDKLCEKLRAFNLQVTDERERWLRQHHEHAGLQLERDRFYCRTCKSVSERL